MLSKGQWAMLLVLFATNAGAQNPQNPQDPSAEVLPAITEQTTDEDSVQTEDSGAESNGRFRDFVPSEKISEDLSVPFPVDI